ncbi:hypothetical protein BCR35DRAFT_311375 [Leucosporidium creatinivorum]|uniref:DUF6534 domain-containing protein n=1 Tax=Leucosporidium creatinivorum TaxID=106004 RepID=A0A1Y2C240_9BASI|nr:hypothetical protein BCR35DRAFT_311375 [Leucosporidium creatinivorum]
MASTYSEAQLDNVLGPFVVGALVAAWLSGLVWGHGGRYWSQYPPGTDRAIFRWGVIVLLGLDLITTIFAAISCYNLSVTELPPPDRAPWSFAINPLLVGIVTTIVQSFYSYRVYVVSNRDRFLPAFILLLALLQLGFATGGAHIAFTLRYEQFLPQYKYGVTLWLTLACAGDFLITGSIVWYLRKAQKGSGFSETASLLKKISRSTIENNFLTSVLALLDAVLFAEVNGNWHIAINIVLPKVYILSFLASLTARSKLSMNRNPTKYNQGGSVEPTGSAAEPWKDMASGIGSRIGRSRSAEGGEVKRETVIMVTMDQQVTHDRVEDESEWSSSERKRRRSRSFLAPSVGAATPSLEIEDPIEMASVAVERPRDT